MNDRARVAVIGGGITGLTVARRIARSSSGPDQAPHVTVLEATSRLGGKVNTQEIDGLPVDTGPDAVMLRVPAMAALIDDLGLTDAVAAPAPTGAYIWSRRALRKLPAGTLFGVPDKILPLAKSRLLSPWGLMRAGGDLVLPRRPLPPDPTVSQLLEPRLGRQVIDRLVQPLLGGVHAGSTDELSATSAVPEVAALLRGGRSVYLASRSRPTLTATGPALVSLDGGLSRLVDALTADLPGLELRTGVKVTEIERVGSGFRLTLNGTEHLEVDAVVLATPAYTTADLLSGLAPGAADAAREIPYVGVATVTLAYPKQAVRRPLDATGFLVPPVEGRLLVGCTWLSAKWSALENSDQVLIRAMVGRRGDQRWLHLDNDQLVTQVHDELIAAMSLAGPPVRTLVQRWPDAIPQYTVGHADRLSRIDAALADVPGLYLTGAGYRGSGIASCVSDATRTADAVLTRLADISLTTGGHL